MKSITYRVSGAYARLNVSSLVAFGTGVETHFYLQPKLANPPVTQVELRASITALRDAVVAQINGGKAATATKNLCQEALLENLQKLAFYVQLACENELPVLLGSGFNVTNTTRTRVALAKPSILRIVPGLSGEALVTVTADRNAKSYEVRVADVGPDNIPGPFRPAVVRTGSRNMSVPGLEPGTLCVFQVRAVGGLVGFSDWSDAVVQRAS